MSVTGCSFTLGTEDVQLNTPQPLLVSWLFGLSLTLGAKRFLSQKVAFTTMPSRNLANMNLSEEMSRTDKLMLKVFVLKWFWILPSSLRQWGCKNTQSLENCSGSESMCYLICPKKEKSLQTLYIMKAVTGQSVISVWSQLFFMLHSFNGWKWTVKQRNISMKLKHLINIYPYSLSCIGYYEMNITLILLSWIHD